MAPRLSVVFLRLAGDRANVTPIPKGPPSFSVAIISVLSKVF